jgi:hypothetical protein
MKRFMYTFMFKKVIYSHTQQIKHNYIFVNLPKHLLSSK